MQTTKVLKSVCPVCLGELDHATSLIEKVSPSPGDISICINCAVTLVFNEDLSLRAATDSDLEGVDQTQLVLTRRAVMFANQEAAKRATKM